MKTILIPTDFSEKSLQLIKNAVLHFPEESIKIVLASGYKMTFSNYSFSSCSRPKLIRSLANKNYYKTLSNLILEHKNIISKVKIELYTGSTNEDFKDFLTTNDIDESIIPNSPLNHFRNKKCFDLTRLINEFIPKVSQVAYQNEDPSEPNRFWLFNLKQQFSFK